MIDTKTVMPRVTRPKAGAFQGEIKAHVGPVFPLTAAKLAYARARHGLRRGKIALRVLDLDASSNGETQN